MENTTNMNTSIHTVADLIAARVRTAPLQTALIDEHGAELSYGDMSDQVLALAAQLAGAAQGHDGRPRIGIVLPNGPDLSVTLLSVAIAGEATPFNPALTAAELERYFVATRIGTLVVAEDDSGPAAAVATAMGLTVLRLTKARTIAGAAGGGLALMPKPEDIAMVLMTSGSTGLPKIVPLSHRNVCCSAADVARSVALGPQDRCLVMWQQFHIGGLVDLLLAPLLVGSTLIVTRGFNEAQFFDLLDRLQPTWFQGVPTTLGALVQHAERHGLDSRGTSLRFIRSVAAALTSTLQDRLTETFGVPVVRTLGMTEASPLITSTALPPALDKPGSVGRPCGPDLCVFGTGLDSLGTGQTGEIAIRGDNVFAGYEADADANAGAFREGWFFTGDTGYLDADGDLFLSGRTKEQINRGGYKIMPSEVEEALSAHPAVHEAAVFGLPHRTLGEDIAAAVSLKTGAQTDMAALRSHLSGLLAANKVPGRVAILTQLPRNPVGKLDRLALAQSAAVDIAATEAGPRNAMERFLVNLWSRELSLGSVGVDQDFTMVGGDSLSALRVLVAMETAFGRPVPDELVMNFSTITEIAASLTEEGFHLSEDDSAEVLAERALDQTVVGTEDLQGADAFANALGMAKDKIGVEAAFEGLTVYETPAAIRATLRNTDAAVVAASASAPVRYLMRRRFHHEAADITSEIDAGGLGMLGWSRENLNPATMLYSDPSNPVWEKTLIVGFSGKLMRLQLPTYRVLLHLDPARFDLLLLRDVSHRLFGSGLPDMGDSIMQLGGWLDDFATTQGYARRIALGTSGGGLAAIHTGLAYGWDRAVATSVPLPSMHTELDAALRKLATQSVPETTELVVAHARNDRDTYPAQQIITMFPKARLDFQERFTSHNILNSAQRAGSLRRLFDDWFD